MKQWFVLTTAGEAGPYRTQADAREAAHAMNWIVISREVVDFTKHDARLTFDLSLPADKRAGWECIICHDKSGRFAMTIANALKAAKVHNGGAYNEDATA